MLTKNVGSVDRAIRIVLGLALLAGFFLNGGGSYSWLYLVGAVVALATGIFSSCGLYKVFGFSTCPLEKP